MEVQCSSGGLVNEVTSCFGHPPAAVFPPPPSAHLMQGKFMCLLKHVTQASANHTSAFLWLQGLVEKWAHDPVKANEQQGALVGPGGGDAGSFSLEFGRGAPAASHLTNQNMEGFVFSCCSLRICGCTAAISLHILSHLILMTILQGRYDYLSIRMSTRLKGNTLCSVMRSPRGCQRGQEAGLWVPEFLCLGPQEECPQDAGKAAKWAPGAQGTFLPSAQHAPFPH